MKWNWQQKDWPAFNYNKTEIEKLEKQFLKSSGILIGAFKHLSEDDKTQLKVDLISNEALKTSEIEGEFLNRDSVQSSIRKAFGVESDYRKIPPAENGISEMMISLYRSFNQELSHKMLFTWHEMLCNGRRDLHEIGGYRRHKEPMQVISGPLHKQNIHFEAPPSEKMVYEMDRFIKSFNLINGEGGALTRASIAHLYFVCIHPFEDGNGRIGRAIAEKALAESLGFPTLIALSYTIEKHNKEYYDALEQANKNNEITEWVLYFVNTILEAQKHTQSQVELLIAKTKFFDKFRDTINKRQEKVVLRMFEEGVDGFKGGLSADNYQRIAKTSSATSTRDLKDLIEKGAFTKIGELKYTRYHLKLDISE